METRKSMPSGSLINHPTEIRVSDRLGSSPISMDPNEFAKQNGFIWTEDTILKNVSDLDNLTRRPEMSESMVKRVFDEIEQNRKKIVITNMGETGYGVFAAENIGAKCYVAIYAGLLQVPSDEFPLEKLGGPYVIGIDQDKNKNSFASINADHYRNIAALIQHTPESASDYRLIGDTKYDIATANLKCVCYNYQGRPLMIIKTIDRIKAGTMLGLDYGVNYWNALNRIPNLFTQTGETIPAKEYEANKISLVLNADGRDLNGQLEFSREELNNIFSKGPLRCVSHSNELIEIHRDDFEKKYRANPQSPYVELTVQSTGIKLEQDAIQLLQRVTLTTLSQVDPSLEGPLPLLSEEEKRKVCKGDSVRMRPVYLFDKNGERFKRHQDVALMMHVLYEFGARIINEGNLAFVKKDLEALEKGSSAEFSALIATEKVDTEKASLFIEQYKNLPEFVTESGDRISINPLQTAFVYKVALDHMDAESIYNMYLSVSSSEMTNTNCSVVLPNGGRFFTDHGLSSYICLYIYFNQDKFSSVPSAKENESFSEGNLEYFFYHMFGRVQSNDPLYLGFKQIMNQNLCITDSPSFLALKSQSEMPVRPTVTNDSVSTKVPSIATPLSNNSAALFKAKPKPKPVQVSNDKIGSCLIA